MFAGSSSSSRMQPEEQWKHSSVLALLGLVLSSQIYTTLVLSDLELGCCGSKGSTAGSAATAGVVAGSSTSSFFREDVDGGEQDIKNSRTPTSTSSRSISSHGGSYDALAESMSADPSSIGANDSGGQHSRDLRRRSASTISRPPPGNRASVRPSGSGVSSASLLAEEDEEGGAGASSHEPAPQAPQAQAPQQQQVSISLGALLEKEQRQQGIGVVLGVGKSRTVFELLQEWTQSPGLYLCDPFIHFSPEVYDNPEHNLSDKDSQMLFEAVQAELAAYQGRFSMVRDLAQSFATMFRAQNAQASLVFVDNNPARIEKDIEDWWPLVSPGGVFAGAPSGNQVVVSAVEKLASQQGKRVITLLGGYWAIVK
ncbi:unnamed protein product [Amoebophrya sp. A25]|nr:unnamed protein product [Amoebophrya sp. A25]|eukprot:GSA25T00027226001.1